jgi:uncharacterized membrane protein YeaQ/YmgE (transglycosylase-associated protein family)
MRLIRHRPENIMENGPIEIVQFVRFLDGLGDGWAAIVILGVLAGFIARFVTTSEKSVGLLSTCLLGIAGAVLGVYGAKALGYAPTGTGTRFLAALAGSLLLATAGTLLRRKPPVRPAS